MRPGGAGPAGRVDAGARRRRRRRCAGGASAPWAGAGTPASSSYPGCPWCRSGPYRLLAHPNYVAVVVEGVALPLVHAAWVTALVFTVAQRGPADGADPRRERRARAPSRRPPDARPRGRRRRPGRAGDRAVRRPRRARRRRPGAAPRRHRQGLRRGADARRRSPTCSSSASTSSAARSTGIRYVDGRHAVEAWFRAGPGRGVRRTDAARGAAGDRRERRGQVEPRPVRTVEQADDRVLVDGEPARYLVAADGLHSPRAPAARPRRPRRGRGAGSGCARHVADARRGPALRRGALVAGAARPT